MIFFKFMVSCEWAIQEKIHFSKKHLEISQNCYNHWNFQAKNQNPCHGNFTCFFLSLLEIPLLCYWPLCWIWNFHILFIYSIPLEIPCPQLPSLFGFFWNGICKLIKTCHWGTVTWVIFGIWKKSKTNHVSKNSFKRHNISYTLMKYSTYNI